MLAMILTGLILGALGVLFVGSVGALRDGIKARGRLRGMLMSGMVLLLSLIGMFVILV